MGYLYSVEKAFMLYPFIAILFTFPFVWYEYHKRGSISIFRVLVMYSFVLYILAIYLLAILPFPDPNSINKHVNMTNLVPFRFVIDIIKNLKIDVFNPKTYINVLTEPAIYTVAFNIVMFVPLGMYLRYYFKCSLSKTIIIAFLVSLFIEVTQLTGLYGIFPYPYRIFDVDDLIINTFGGFVGYYTIGLIIKYLPTTERLDEKAYIKSKRVSGIRRVFSTILDYVLFTLIVDIILTLTGTNSLIDLVVFIIYYILMPYITDGFTLGKWFLNIRMVYEDKPLYRNILRLIFNFIYYLVIPLIIILAMIAVHALFNLSRYNEIIIYGIMALIMMSYYLVNLLYLLKHKEALYDRFLKVSYISTFKKGSN